MMRSLIYDEHLEVEMTRSIQVATSIPRAGRLFQPIQELELHKDALDAVKKLPGANRGLLVVPEFAGPIGIPDFTAFVGNIDRIRNRQNLNVNPVVNELDAGIISATYTKRTSKLQDISSSLGWPEETVATRLQRLVRRGALIEATTGKFIRPEQLESPGRLYAVETKVNDWRGALRQVRTYRVWADSYVLVLGKLNERAQLALAEEVRKDRGGLIVDGHWILRPRLGNTVARRRLQASELFAAATKNGLCDPTLAPSIHA